ncbi:Bifunctional protein FolD 4 [Cardamine amara subsp. amara]|uniref:Bifunctional protein FolD 4 n=1 Tax=Cardamine amara subsp. amara TaxID=228776 RepID=A0ABD0ZZS9_CARAN
MASMMFTECSSSRLIDLNRSNGAFLPRQCIGQLRLRNTSASGRGCTRSSSSPTAIVMDGEAVAKKIRDEIRVEVRRMKESIGVVPGLAVIRVGDIEESLIEAKEKKKACESVGMKSFEVDLAEDSSEEEVLKYVLGFNDDPRVHGIIAQLPLPSRMDVVIYVYAAYPYHEVNIWKAVSRKKYVDGIFYGFVELFVPSTPKGGIELLHRYNIEINGKSAFVLTESASLGMPIAQLLQREGAFVVTMFHSTAVKNPENITRHADIIITAAGQPNLVRGSWIKPGAVIIDAGINSVEDPSAPHGYRLVGDVCYEGACKVASAITPVPGGVQPMNIPMLLSNTLTSAKRIHNFH